MSSAISPKYQSLDNTWDHILFDDCLDNIVDLTKEQAKAILKVWFISVLLRDGLASRPILALFGQPGSGKSTLFRRIYTLMYGRNRGIGAVTREDDFDYAVSTDPLVVLDNVDTCPKWLPDRLAVMAAPNEILKRKLYTDTEVIRLKRNAMMGVTAHAPKFGREDITDRLLLLNFERLSNFKSETIILDRIMGLRNAIWGSVLQDIRTVLNTKMPTSGYPQFRIEDFAIYGYWIATALGVGSAFYDGLTTIRRSQRGFILEEDSIIIDSIARFLDKQADGKQKKPMTAGELWPFLLSNSSDVNAFEKKYRNAITLGRKIWTLIDAIREVFDVEWSTDRKGSRSFLFTRKVGENVTA